MLSHSAWQILYKPQRFQNDQNSHECWPRKKWSGNNFNQQDPSKFNRDSSIQIELFGYFLVQCIKDGKLASRSTDFNYRWDEPVDLEDSSDMQASHYSTPMCTKLERCFETKTIKSDPTDVVSSGWLLFLNIGFARFRYWIIEDIRSLVNRTQTM